MGGGGGGIRPGLGLVVEALFAGELLTLLHCRTALQSVFAAHALNAVRSILANSGYTAAQAVFLRQAPIAPIHFMWHPMTSLHNTFFAHALGSISESSGGDKMPAQAALFAQAICLS